MTVMITDGGCCSYGYSTEYRYEEYGKGVSIENEA